MGPTRSRRAGRSRRSASAATSATNDAAGQRRNGFPALTCTTTIGWRRGSTPSAASLPSTERPRPPTRHFGRIAFGIRCPDAERRDSRSHWLTTECRGRSARARSTRSVFIQLRPVTAYPIRRGAPVAQGEPGAARPAVQVEHQVVARGAQASRQPEIGGQSPAGVGRRRDDHFVQVRIGDDNRRRLGFDEVREAGFGVTPPKRPRSGVVNTTSPMRRRRIAGCSRTGRRTIAPSTLASSSSMTGMPSSPTG